MSITLVTGATGLVGSHVARALVARGDRVRVTAPAHAALDAIADLDVEVVAVDVTDRRDMRRALRGGGRPFPPAGGGAPPARREGGVRRDRAGGARGGGGGAGGP